MMVRQSGQSPLPPSVNCPIGQRAGQLFAYVTASEGRTPPSASLLADRIERYLHTQPASGNCARRKPATEAELSETFGVGRRLVRQSSRLLQQRGVIKPRRGGGGAGGLKLSVPEPMQVASALVDAVRHDIGGRAIQDARSILLPLASHHRGALGELLRGTVTCLDSKSRGSPVADEPGSQAVRLADELCRRMAENASKPGDFYLGSLDSISLQYGTSLEVTVEAVRLLEDRQQVALRRGRGGGVYSAAGSVAQVAHMANAFFAGEGVTTEQCDAILRAVNVELINLACDRATPAALERMRDALHAMSRAGNATQVGISWYPLQRELATAADSPVLHLVAQCVAASLLLRRLRTAELPDAGARELLDASRTIAGNVARGKVGGNREAHWRCQDVLVRHW